MSREWWSLLPWKDLFFIYDEIKKKTYFEFHLDIFICFHGNFLHGKEWKSESIFFWKICSSKIGFVLLSLHIRFRMFMIRPDYIHFVIFITSFLQQNLQFSLLFFCYLIHFLTIVRNARNEKKTVQHFLTINCANRKKNRKKKFLWVSFSNFCLNGRSIIKAVFLSLQSGFEMKFRPTIIHRKHLLISKF